MQLFDHFQRIANQLDASDMPALDNDLSMSMAKVLKWNSGSASTELVDVTIGSMQITRGFIGPQPAALFAVSNGFTEQQHLNRAAFYAYQTSIPWGVVVNINGMTIFNSHWIRKNEWFNLPFISWDEIERNMDIISSITPDGISNGDIEKVATKIYQPDRFLRSIDDALVERLDYWRSETLRYSKNIKSVDENLQTLFAQLFILRAVEDRRLAPSLPVLKEFSNISGDVDLKGLNDLLKKAQNIIGSELFDIDTLNYIPIHVLGGIINDLYTPHHIPDNSLRYNFDWIDADVLGLAYEKYLSTVLTPIAPSPQISMFEQPLREVERISVRKSGGVYYTPQYLVQYLTEACLDQVNTILTPGCIPRIADFACGSGSFLVAATDALIRRLQQYDKKRNWAREIISGKYIIGIDIDERAVTIARLALWLRFAEEPDPLPLPRLEEIIIHGDSLGVEVWSLVPSEYDIILGNPPFLATGRTPSREELSTRFKTAQGRYDYSYLFVELAVKYLSNSGILGLVVPNRLFRNRDAGNLRDILTTDTDLLTIMDFGSNRVFEHTNAYVGTIMARKNKLSIDNQNQYVRVVNIDEISSNFIATKLIEANETNSEIYNDMISAYNSPHPRGSKPWVLASPASRKIRTFLENSGENLSSIAGIYQGIRTGANDIFIVEIDDGNDGVIAKIRNGLGESAIIEIALLHPVVYGSDIQRYDIVSAKNYLIYPYIDNKVIPETELMNKYPQTFAYLLRYRNILSERISIESSGLRWYELVRKRDQNWLMKPKILIRDLAMKTSFAIDKSGGIFLVGGTAVIPADSDILLALMAYLNSDLINDYISQITPSFNKGFQKFEPQHLQQIPVLLDVINDDEILDELSRLCVLIIEAKMLGHEEIIRNEENNIENILRKLIHVDRIGD